MNPLKTDLSTIQTILAKARAQAPLSRTDLETLLAVREPQGLDALFETARALRNRHFGDRIFLYGFTLFSTYCRNNCAFCSYRNANREMNRYRKSWAETLDAADALARSGVNLIDLTMGEDPRFLEDGGGIGHLVALTKEIKKRTSLPVMISPGVLPDPAILDLAGAGADWYACYQETHNPGLFSRLRLGQRFEKRMAAKRAARRAGLLIEEGVLCGVGETVTDLARSIEAMIQMDAAQVRVMTFIPQDNTPMASHAPTERARELAALAVMRLALPDRLIPASLDVDGLDGVGPRLRAGANVVTSIVPPGQGWAGVANNSLDIDDARRTSRAVTDVLKSLGLAPATPHEYRLQLDRLRVTSRDTDASSYLKAG